jgi:hypothetical protein
MRAYVLTEFLAEGLALALVVALAVTAEAPRHLLAGGILGAGCLVAMAVRRLLDGLVLWQESEPDSGDDGPDGDPDDDGTPQCWGDDCRRGGGRRAG